VSKYAEPWAAAFSGLKRDLEEDMMEKVFEIYIKTTPERLWEAITDGETGRKNSFGTRAISDWKPSFRYELTSPDGTGTWGKGENLEVDPRAGSSRASSPSGARRSRPRGSRGGARVRSLSGIGAVAISRRLSSYRLTSRSGI
jgi:hypothetical protein